MDILTTATAPVPDALLVPEALKRGATWTDRLDSILTIVEPILQVDRGAGERGWVRRQGDGWLFVSKSPGDSIFFPHNHPRRGHDRYRWVLRDSGIKWGYLVDDAKRRQD